MDTAADDLLDCRGLSCPVPKIKLVLRLRKLASGTVVELLETDPGSKTDIPKWCAKTGNVLLKTEERAGVYHYFIRKK